MCYLDKSEIGIWEWLVNIGHIVYSLMQFCNDYYIILLGCKHKEWSYRYILKKKLNPLRLFYIINYEPIIHKTASLDSSH